MGIYMNIFKIPVVCTVLALTVECRSNYGTEFFFGFPFNQYEHNLCNQLTVDIASEFEGKATLILPFKTEIYFICKQNITSISVNCSLALFGNYTKFNGVYLKTTVNVSVFATDYSRHSSSTFLILPHAVLGRSYVTASYLPKHRTNDREEQSYILIIGTENMTDVVISDSRGLIFNNYTINHLEIAQFASSDDLTAFRVESNKPVVVITGSSCSYVPVRLGGCDSLMQEMIPNGVTDDIFVVPPIPNTPAYELRVMKTSNASHSRVCFHNKTHNFCVNDSVSLSFLIDNDPTVVIADQSHSIIQYGVGRMYAEGRMFGDPFMTIVPGIHNYLNKYVFLIPDTYKRCNNFISVTIPNVYVDGLVLDGGRPNISKIYNVTAPLANYSVLSIDTVIGYHVIYHTITEVTFGVLVYGYGFHETIGYGYPAGMLMNNRADEYMPTELITSPASSVSPSHELNILHLLEAFKTTEGNYPVTTIQNISENTSESPTYNYSTNRSDNFSATSESPTYKLNNSVSLSKTTIQNTDRYNYSTKHNDNISTTLASPTYEMNISHSLEAFRSTVESYLLTTVQNTGGNIYPTNRIDNFSATPNPYIVGSFSTPTLVQSSSLENETKELAFGKDETRVSAGTIVGITMGIIALAIIFILIAFLVKRKRKIKPNFIEARVDEAENTSARGVTENTGQSDQ